MVEVLLQMSGLIFCGVVWRLARPAGLQPQQTRTVLTSLVYYLLLPALVLSVLWRAELGANSLYIVVAAAVGVITGIIMSWFSCRACRSHRAETGAVILAAAFPNATYMGLPVLEAMYGPWARSVAIQYDLFACTPLLFTLGVMISARMGGVVTTTRKQLHDVARIPALWAAVVAIVLNLLNAPMPLVVEGWLDLLQRGVVPLMLISLGLSLRWDRDQWVHMPALFPVIIIRLFLVPAVVLLLLMQMGVTGDLRSTIVLEAAMPSMVIGLVLCDRFNLNVTLYATAVTVTTLLSLVTLPMWFAWLGSVQGM